MKRIKMAAAAAGLALVATVGASSPSVATSGDAIYNCGATQAYGICHSYGQDIYVQDDSGFFYHVDAGYWSYKNAKGFWVDPCWEAMNMSTGNKFPGNKWYYFSPTVPNYNVSLSKYKVC